MNARLPKKVTAVPKFNPAEAGVVKLTCWVQRVPLRVNKKALPLPPGAPTMIVFPLMETALPNLSPAALLSGVNLAS